MKPISSTVSHTSHTHSPPPVAQPAVNRATSTQQPQNTALLARDTMSAPVRSGSGPVEMNPGQRALAAGFTAAPGLDSVASGQSVIKLGQQGDSIKQVQQLLGMKGEAVDGLFGMDTEQAVKGFQKTQGLEVDGKVGPKTLTALQQANQPSGKWKPAPSLADVESGKAVLKQGMQGPAVAELQKRLGLEADGKFGEKTEAAVKDFQKEKGLKPPAGMEGQAGKTTLDAAKKAAAHDHDHDHDHGNVGGKPSTSNAGSASGIRAGGGWAGSEGVADAAKAIARERGIPVTSLKRTLADTKRVGSSTNSDHYVGNKTAYAVDFGVEGKRGDELAKAIAKKYGIPESHIGTFKKHTITIDGEKYNLQLLWKVKNHYDHVHLGIRKA
ncbi:MAG TPA: peptidoglycan-binding protein [Myxococcaceae bacterium]|nr:peptidoglycan-binding protein [Myxococcaceae bacterium]